MFMYLNEEYYNNISRTTKSSFTMSWLNDTVNGGLNYWK